MKIARGNSRSARRRHCLLVVWRSVWLPWKTSDLKIDLAGEKNADASAAERRWGKSRPYIAKATRRASLWSREEQVAIPVTDTSNLVQKDLCRSILHGLTIPSLPKVPVSSPLHRYRTYQLKPAFTGLSQATKTTTSTHSRDDDLIAEKAYSQTNLRARRLSVWHCS